MKALNQMRIRLSCRWAHFFVERGLSDDRCVLAHRSLLEGMSVYLVDVVVGRMAVCRLVLSGSISRNGFVCGKTCMIVPKPGSMSCGCSHVVRHSLDSGGGR